MNNEEDFNNFLNNFFIENYIPDEIKNLIHFRTFDNYFKTISNQGFTIYEDWWIRKPDVVKNKIKTILKKNTLVYARNCEVKRINKTVSNSFINAYHILDAVNSKINLGLFFKNELISVMSFSAQRTFRDGSRSIEILRFCNKDDFVVTGGLAKLITACSRDYKPDSIMTYIDLDWGRGDAFLKQGFIHTETKPPIVFYVNRKTGKRIPEKNFNDFKCLSSYLKTANKGSLKMLKQII